MTRLTLPLIFLLAMSALAIAAPSEPRDPIITKHLFALSLPQMSSPDLNARKRAQEGWQEACLEAGAPGREAARAEVCGLMIAVLDEKTPTVSRVFLLKQLERIGRDEAIDPVSALLDNKDDLIRDAAVRCLANNPVPRATGKLLERLPAAEGKARIGLINALGERADLVAVGSLTKVLNAPDPTAAQAAARALGRIPAPVARKALLSARVEAKGDLRKTIADALIVHAERLRKAGETAQAGEIYKELLTKDEARPVRLAALRGTILTAGDHAGELVRDVLAGSDAAATAVAVGQIEYLSAAALKPLVAGLDQLPLPTRVLILRAIANRGDRSQLPMVLKAANSKETELRQAGILALGRLGDLATVDMLLEWLSADPATASAAGESLTRLSVEGVNEKLIAALEAEKSAARAFALVGILERRKAITAVPALLALTRKPDAGLRKAAWAGLRGLASPIDVPDMVLALQLSKTAPGADRDQAEQAIVAVCEQIPEKPKRAALVLNSLPAMKIKYAPDLLLLLSRLGGPEVLKLTREAVASSEAADRMAGLSALFNWPDVLANDDLLTLAKEAKDAADRRRALKAVIRINGATGERSVEERRASFAALKKAMDLADRDDERKAILHAFGNVRLIESLRFVVPYLDQSPLAESACRGVVDLAHSKNLREPNKAEFARALDRAIAQCKDKGLVERAKAYKEGR